MITSNQGAHFTVSVGMPVYNGAKYIQEALDSLLAQTHQKIEIIISDNASTDATESICRRYAAQDTRIKYFRQSENLGAVANFQFVLNKASGKFFMWAACDDIWSDDWIKALLDAILKTDAKMAFGKVVHIDSKSALIDHPANQAKFSYMGNATQRRASFYLAHEALGKANLINGLYEIEMRPILDEMLSEYTVGISKFDYTLVFNSLKYSKLICAKHGVIYKRIHAGSEGAQNNEVATKTNVLMKGVSGILHPVVPGLINEYLNHSSNIEKWLLVGLLPAKFLGVYIFRLRQIMAAIKRSC